MDGSQRALTKKEKKQQKEAIYNVIEKLDFSAIYQSSPVEVLEGYTVCDIESFKYYVNLIFVNADKKPISELNIRLLCYANQNIPYFKIPFTFSAKYDSFGGRKRVDEVKKTNPFKKHIEAPYIQTGEQFGWGVYIPLPESFYKKLELEITSVKFTDGTVKIVRAVNGISYKHFSQLDPDRKFAYKQMNIYNMAEEKYPIRIIPVKAENAWLCCCGHKNIMADMRCARCKRDREWQLNNVNDTAFDEVLENEASNVTPDFVHHRKAQHAEHDSIETDDEAAKKIKEYQDAIAEMNRQEKEKSRKRKRIILGIVAYFVGMLLLIFILQVIRYMTM